MSIYLFLKAKHQHTILETRRLQEVHNSSLIKSTCITSQFQCYVSQDHLF